MGVHGLWKLIEPSGKPVPLETLENKVLAVDVSIWLHHFIKGFQDGAGAPVPNAHLLGIYHRLCKLLYFKIKPVFVFDGGVPALKRQTIALRNQRKSKNLSEADRIHKNLLSALVKHTAISKVLSEKAKAAITASTSPIKKGKPEDDDLYVLPPSQFDSTISSSSEEESSGEDSEPSRQYDLHSIDTQSVEFKSLPADVRHEILTDLKETRKQSSWGRINELPAQSDDFSVYQMRRLLKRQSVQSALEEVEKEMGGHSLSLGELEQLLKDQGVISNMKGNRIASDENTRFLLIRDIKQAVEDAKKQSNLQAVEEGNEAEEKKEGGEDKTEKNKGEQEFEDDLEKAIALSLEEAPSTSKEEQPSSSTGKVKKVGGKGKNRMPLSFLADFDAADFDDSESSEEESIQMRLTPAQRYMMEYSNLTPSEIARILASKAGVAKKVETQKGKEDARTSIKPAELLSAKENKVIPDIVRNIVDVEASIEVSEDEEIDKVTTSTVEPTEVEEKDVVEVMSDSGSSNCDDFVDVEETNKQRSAPSMEVVIKPVDKIEDDLFKDIFENEEKPEESKTEIEKSNIKDTVIQATNKQKSTSSLEVVNKANKEMEDDLFKHIFEKEDKAVESINQFVSSTTEEDTIVNERTKSVEIVEEKKLEEESPKGSLKTKIETLIREYSKPKEKTEEPEAPQLSVEQLSEMKENLRKEQAQLVAQRGTKERLAGNLTDQIHQEAQELLELFGVPYIVAPMEAEAQCAFLELIDLTDGTITDDSDIWLFGGRTVYKNFFNQSKTVLEFKSENVHQHYKLTREQMILLAMLVGSDYTTGLTGVGPVTALEILAAFPPKSQLVSGLAEFKSWFNRGMLPGPGRTSLRRKLKNLKFSENFPNPQIVEAYLDPQVETSKDNFTWAKPDVIGLVDFAKHKFGWTKTKTNEILNPVLKKLEENRTQKSITDYFRYHVKVDPKETEKAMSKRVKTALDRIGKGSVEDEEPKPKKKRVTKEKKEDGEGKNVKEPKSRSRKKVGKSKEKKEEEDEEMKILEETEARSKKRVEEIQKEVHREVEEQKQKVNFQRLHKKEVIPQKQKDKTDKLQNKLKAIETFRKSKQGPGYVKKQVKTKRPPKDSAGYLSESSSSD